LNVNLNGGAGGIPVQNIPRTAWTIPTTPVPTREGYTFGGWSLTAGGAAVTVVPAGEVELTIHALWTPSAGTSPSPSPSPGPGNGDGNGNGGGGGGSGNSPPPGTTAPPAGVTRPTGTGGITVIEHFGTWTGSGTRTARVDADHTTFQRLWFGENLVSTAHLTIASGSTAITLSEAFISGLSDGTYSFVSEFTGGHATLNLIVSTGFGNVPQTGVPDITPTIIIMGIAIYLTLVTGTMLFFHLKQKRAAKNN
jgi:uncharacterized repeat protein (TIGR02543 family)